MFNNKSTEEQAADSTSVMLNDDQISKLMGTLSRKAQESLQEMADAVRGGASPYDAFLKASGDFMALLNEYIPQARYGGLTWQAYRDQVYLRATAIVDDTTGRYTDETKNAVMYVVEAMDQPGNETDLTFEDLARVIARAENGEALTMDDVPESERFTQATVNDDEGGSDEHDEHVAFDPVEAVDHLISIILGGTDGNRACDELYRLIMLASESKD